MHRRTFLAVSVAAGAASLLRSRPARAAADYSGVKTGSYLTDLTVLATVEAQKIFTEGPCCDRRGTVYFTNTAASAIMRWDGKALSVFRQDKNAANGLLFDRQGRLVACEGESGRVTRTDMATGAITVLCDQFEGKPLGGPNDLAFDAAGRIYFTSRMAPTASAVNNSAGGNVNSVYRIDPDGRVTRVLHAPDIDMPNGLVTSPDDKILYLVESDGREGRKRKIVAYDLSADGTPTNPRTHVEFYPGRSGDGMAIDAEGNLYIAAGLHKTRGTSETLDTRPGIHVVTPAGKLVDFLETPPPDTLTNCRFGGEDLRTLYITSGNKLLSAKSRIPGKSLYRPEA
jgi:gluconolactonase